MRHPHEFHGRTAEHDERPGRGTRGGPGGPGRGGPGGPGGRGRFRGGPEVEVPPADGIEAWLTGRLPDGWALAEVQVDRDEVLVVIAVEAPAVEGQDAQAVRESEAGRISRWREETRDARVTIALETEARYVRKVAWGAVAGDTRALFTHLSVPVMTRLRQPERQVLDTLVDSGVARSRSEALAWCVKLVGEHSESWLSDLREAMKAVQAVREQGPGAS